VPTQDDLETLLPEVALKDIHGLVSFKLGLSDGLSLEEPVDDAFRDLWLLRSMPHLTKLDLGGNSLPVLPPALTNLTVLEELNLGNNRVLKLSEECMEVLKSLPQLRKVTVDSPVWSAATSRPLPGIAAMSSNLEVELC